MVYVAWANLNMIWIVTIINSFIIIFIVLIYHLDKRNIYGVKKVNTDDVHCTCSELNPNWPDVNLKLKLSFNILYYGTIKGEN